MSMNDLMQHIHPHRCDPARPRGCAIWITGLSGSGKSTTAYAVEARLQGEGIACHVLDGDNLRHGINRDLGFTLQERAENIRRTAEIAKLFGDAGLVAIVSLISPLASDRAMARDIIGAEVFIEVFMSTPIEVCERRDPKALYKKARLGQIQNFTGISSPYQEPAAPDISVSSENATPDELAAIVVAKVRATMAAKPSNTIST
jgi:adenylyl-sulfate kinase